MRKNFGTKTWFLPLPVLIVGSYDKDGKANAMNAAWGGVYNNDQVIVCLDKSHKSTANIKERGEFTLSFATKDQIVSADYVGIVSGNDVPDKLERSGFTTSKAESVDAPVINELPLTLECRVSQILGEENFIADIVNVSADESILGDKGLPDIDKLSPVLFDTIHAEYRTFGDVAAKAFKAGSALIRR